MAAARAAHVLLIAAAISAGGAVGAVARWAVEARWPASPGHVPVATLAINVVGSLLIGLLYVAVERRWAHLPLVRPFWGVGVLGGFTTFSVYALEVRALLADAPLLALAYFVVTPVLAVGAALAGELLGERVLGPEPEVSAWPEEEAL